MLNKVKVRGQAALLQDLKGCLNTLNQSLGEVDAATRKHIRLRLTTLIREFEDQNANPDLITEARLLVQRYKQLEVFGVETPVVATASGDHDDWEVVKAMRKSDSMDIMALRAANPREVKSMSVMTDIIVIFDRVVPENDLRNCGFEIQRADCYVVIKNQRMLAVSRCWNRPYVANDKVAYTLEKGGDTEVGIIVSAKKRVYEIDGFIVPHSQVLGCVQEGATEVKRKRKGSSTLPEQIELVPLDWDAQGEADKQLRKLTRTEGTTWSAAIGTSTIATFSGFTLYWCPPLEALEALANSRSWSEISSWSPAIPSDIKPIRV